MNSQVPKFFYPEDYILFGYLVANQLCEPEDSLILVRHQEAQKSAKQLLRILGARSALTRRMENVLQSQVGPQFKAHLEDAFPNLPEILDVARSASSDLIRVLDPVDSLCTNTESIYPLIEELRDKRVQLGNCERQLQAWADASVLFLEKVEALEADEEFGDTWRKAAASLRRQFTKSFGAVGFHVLIPERGDTFDSAQHQAESVDTTPDDLAPSSVVSTLQWGYRFPNGRILKAVVTITPERKQDHESE